MTPAGVVTYCKGIQMAEIQVQLEGGDVVKVDGEGWSVGERGLLDVLAEADGDRAKVVASFASGGWVSVAKGEREGGLSLGECNVTVNVDPKWTDVSFFREEIADNLLTLADKPKMQESGGASGLIAAAHMVREGLV